MDSVITAWRWGLLDLMMAHDAETQFMMLEPGERKTTVAEQERSSSFQSTRNASCLSSKRASGLSDLWWVSVSNRSVRHTACPA